MDGVLAAILVIATAGICTVLVSRFMWWATSRSPMWAMLAGALLLTAIAAAAVLAVWWMSRAASGP